MLDSNDLQAGLKAVSALETIGYARAKDLIIDALYNENPLIREKSVSILGLSGDKTVVNLLFDQLSDQNINVLKASLKALHSLLKDSMTEDLHNKDLQKRKQVVKSLGAIIRYLNHLRSFYMMKTVKSDNKPFNH